MTHSTQSHQQTNGLLSVVRLVSQYRWFVLIMTVLTTASFYGLNVAFNDFEYRSDAQVMVIQYSDAASVDGEKMQRSTENISRNLVKVVDTTSFMDKALANPVVPANLITGATEKEKKKSWSETVSASTVPNSSIIQVSVYDTDPQAAAILAQVVADTLIANAADYHGAVKSAIELKQIDKVSTSDKPVRPNIPMVTFAGFVVGLLGSITYLFLVKEWRLVSVLSAQWKEARAEQIVHMTTESVTAVHAAPVQEEVSVAQPEATPVAPAVTPVNEAAAADVPKVPFVQEVIADIPEVIEKIETAVVEDMEQAEAVIQAAEYAVFDVANWGQVIARNILPMQQNPQVVTLSGPIA